MYLPTHKIDLPATNKVMEEIEKAKKRIETLERRWKKRPSERNALLLDAARRNIKRKEDKLRNPYYMCGNFEETQLVSEEEILWHIKNFHPDEENPYLQLMVLNKETGYVKRRACDYKWIETNIKSLASIGLNSYCASASFYRRKGTERADSGDNSVKSIYGIIIDLDYEDTPYGGLLAEDLIETMRVDGIFAEIGEPSYYMQTSQGEGAYLIYLFKDAVRISGNANKVMMWADNAGLFVKYFSAYGADPKCVNASRVFRLPSTYHQESDSWSRIINFDSIKDIEPIRYDYNELIEKLKNLLPQEIEEKEMKDDVEESKSDSIESDDIKPITYKKQSHNEDDRIDKLAKEEKKSVTKDKEKIVVTEERLLSNITHHGEIQDMAYNRVVDLFRLAEYRDYDLEGNRNNLIFIISTQIVLFIEDNDKRLKFLRDFNNCFVEPLKEKELLYSLNSAIDKKYKFTDKTIIKRLQVTKEELAMFSFIGKRANRNEKEKKNRRYSNGQLKSVANRNNRNKRILELRNSGMTYKEIADKMKCSYSTVANVIKAAS